MYQALAESHRRYANVVWGALSNTKLSNLQRYQDRALELIESSKIKDAYNKNILNVNQLLTFDQAVMTFKIVNQLCPEGLQNKFIERSALSKYNIRNMKDLHVQKLKLEHTKTSFLYTGPKAWNSIPTAHPRHRIRCTIQKRSEISPFELIENRFARIHGRTVHGGRERGKHSLSLYCKLLIAIYSSLVSYLTEWMLCLNKIK